MIPHSLIRSTLLKSCYRSVLQNCKLCYIKYPSKIYLTENNCEKYNIKFKKKFSSSSSHRYNKTYKINYYLFGAGVLTSGISLWYLKNLILSAKDISFNAGEEIAGLPEYTAEDVSKHDCKEKRIWVCFKSGVYDITDFIPKHPGGEKILMAAGASLEPFWEIFAVHKSGQVLKMLEEYRIGNLRQDDRALSIENSEDPFALDPKRHPVLEPRSKKPFNAEPPKDLLVENFLTPNEIFFVRNHLPVPVVDPNEYELEIEGISIEPISLSLNDIKTKFKKHTIISAIQCAGNRRAELNKIKEVKGLNWGGAAISNAEWAGARLYDVLKYAGIDFDDEKIQHIQLEGLDTDPANSPYGASIPAMKVMFPFKY